jgi:hypothetical protein
MPSASTSLLYISEKSSEIAHFPSDLQVPQPSPHVRQRLILHLFKFKTSASPPFEMIPSNTLFFAIAVNPLSFGLAHITIIAMTITIPFAALKAQTE